jgi:predicted NUDIX family phosphoesterase
MSQEPKTTTDKDDEVVLCVSAALFDSVAAGLPRSPEGLILDPLPFLKALEQRRNVFWARRGDVEDDPGTRQVCTYPVLRHDGWYWTYRRKGGDSRLDGGRSLGVGGHVGKEDSDPVGEGTRVNARMAVYRAGERELHEEVTIPERSYPGDDFRFNYTAIIDDRSDRVGMCHVGLVMDLELVQPEVYPTAEGKMVDAGWTSPSKLFCTIEQYEGWSRVLIRHALAKSK